MGSASTVTLAPVDEGETLRLTTAVCPWLAWLAYKDIAHQDSSSFTSQSVAVQGILPKIVREMLTGTPHTDNIILRGLISGAKLMLSIHTTS